MASHIVDGQQEQQLTIKTISEDQEVDSATLVDLTKAELIQGLIGQAEAYTTCTTQLVAAWRFL